LVKVAFWVKKTSNLGLKRTFRRFKAERRRKRKRQSQTKEGIGTNQGEKPVNP